MAGEAVPEAEAEPAPPWGWLNCWAFAAAALFSCTHVAGNQAETGVAAFYMHCQQSAQHSKARKYKFVSRIASGLSPWLL